MVDGVYTLPLHNKTNPLAMTQNQSIDESKIEHIYIYQSNCFVGIL